MATTGATSNRNRRSTWAGVRVRRQKNAAHMARENGPERLKLSMPLRAVGLASLTVRATEGSSREKHSAGASRLFKPNRPMSATEKIRTRPNFEDSHGNASVTIRHNTSDPTM